MYYCKSRFYVPKWRRWLIYDSVQYLDVENIGCANLYAYCNNNPVMYSDGDGHFAILTSVIVGAIIGFACSYIPDAVANFKDGFDWSDFNTFEDNWIKSVGVLVGTALVTNFAAGMGVYALREAGNENTKFNFGMMMSGAFGQMFKGALSFAMGGIMSGSGLWKIGKNGKIAQ